MPKLRGSFLAMDLRNAVATRSMASSQVAGRCEPFSRTRGWVRRAFVGLAIEPPKRTAAGIVASGTGAPFWCTKERGILGGAECKLARRPNTAQALRHRGLEMKKLNKAIRKYPILRQGRSGQRTGEPRGQ